MLSVKFDNEKTPWYLLPWGAVREVVRVLKFGAEKYGERNWEQPGLAYHRIYRAAIDHLTYWWEGEDFDKETGLSHLAHAACNCLFLLHYVITLRDDLDTRPSKIRIPTGEQEKE